jgi:hypothetical protein
MNTQPVPTVNPMYRISPQQSTACDCLCHLGHAALTWTGEQYQPAWQGVRGVGGETLTPQLANQKPNLVSLPLPLAASFAQCPLRVPGLTPSTEIRAGAKAEVARSPTGRRGEQCQVRGCVWEGVTEPGCPHTPLLSSDFKPGMVDRKEPAILPQGWPAGRWSAQPARLEESRGAQ